MSCLKQVGEPLEKQARDLRQGIQNFDLPEEHEPSWLLEYDVKN